MTDQRPMAPWWLIGLDVAVAVWYSVILYSISGWTLVLCLPIGFAVFRAWGFMCAAIVQRARFSLKDLLILTCVVAVLCSIYASLGLGVVFVALLMIDVGVTCWVAAGIESAEMTRRHFWHHRPAASDNPPDNRSNSAAQDS